jgi:hypothetical protein
MFSVGFTQRNASIDKKVRGLGSPRSDVRRRALLRRLRNREAVRGLVGGDGDKLAHEWSPCSIH